MPQPQFLEKKVNGNVQGVVDTREAETYQIFYGRVHLNLAPVDVCSSFINVTVPATIGVEEVSIKIDVVENNLPMLLSKVSMNKART